MVHCTRPSARCATRASRCTVDAGWSTETRRSFCLIWVRPLGRWTATSMSCGSRPTLEFRTWTSRATMPSSWATLLLPLSRSLSVAPSNTPVTTSTDRRV
uniref:(northern house mosquito) hypothetical protein n=1 Tax=Culex pipiens TaxID=7175 RepID=A0A8D8B2D8_CULPI